MVVVTIVRYHSSIMEKGSDTMIENIAHHQVVAEMYGLSCVSTGPKTTTSSSPNLSNRIAYLIDVKHTRHNGRGGVKKSSKTISPRNTIINGPTKTHLSNLPDQCQQSLAILSNGQKESKKKTDTERERSLLVTLGGRVSLAGR
ncbi:hypothetical protein CEXT_305121 [Caerostris extrusa]|uniref:Uncharacterized protein n=1 Tax=Caerostris extrusa TaxID=172846 RepID=A0AAV4NYM8_CAEEX|nr:hypothetical protein CEXT_305121 [Caerostris extrusa]